MFDDNTFWKLNTKTIKKMKKLSFRSLPPNMFHNFFGFVACLPTTFSIKNIDAWNDTREKKKFKFNLIKVFNEITWRIFCHLTLVLSGVTHLNIFYLQCPVLEEKVFLFWFVFHLNVTLAVNWIQNMLRGVFGCCCFQWNFRTFQSFS